MKAVIFDIDNTLIENKEEYKLAVNRALDMLNFKYEKDLPLKIYDEIDEFEKNNDLFDKEKLIKYLNLKLNINLPKEFIDMYINTYGEEVTYEDGLEDTLLYLSKKYDLYIITNWFTESQIKRLKKLKIDKYFKKVYGGDINYLKPNPKAFEVILKEYNKEDCIYIGDNLEKDVIIPISIGMKAIWKTNEKSDKYITIKKISDLMNIL